VAETICPPVCTRRRISASSAGRRGKGRAGLPRWGAGGVSPAGSPASSRCPGGPWPSSHQQGVPAFGVRAGPVQDGQAQPAGPERFGLGEVSAGACDLQVSSGQSRAIRRRGGGAGYRRACRVAGHNLACRQQPGGDAVTGSSRRSTCGPIAARPAGRSAASAGTGVSGPLANPPTATDTPKRAPGAPDWDPRCRKTVVQPWSPPSFRCRPDPGQGVSGRPPLHGAPCPPAEWCRGI
jgi:hypothetical protein